MWMGWLARPCVQGVRWGVRGREAARSIAVAMEALARGLGAVALVETAVEVAPVAAFDGSSAAAVTAWANMSAFRIHLRSLLSCAHTMARCCGSSMSPMAVPVK